MPTLASDIINRVRSKYLMSGHNDRLNRLGGSGLADAVGTVVTFALGPQGVTEQSTISVGLEEMYVVSISGNTPGSTASVIRGYNGSPATSHAAGEIIRCNPQFTDWEIFQEMNNALTDFAGEGLFYVKAVVIEFNSSVQGYNFAAPDFLEPYKLTYDAPGPEREWAPFALNDYYVDRHPDPTDFPGGHQLVLRRGAYPGRNMRLSYEASFGTLTGLSDDVESVSGLHSQGHNLLALEAAVRTMTGDEIKRNFLSQQPQPRRAEEVPPGAIQQSMQGLLAARQEALNNYMRFLAKRYPKQVV